ncbi:MAG: rRNA maturation RNase YbeY [Silicimonas sp.]|nr:rRNA maturation RNase YbeY [Silicimonas sp.]
MSVEVVTKDRRWENTALAELAEAAFSVTLSHLGLEAGDWDIAILGCNDQQIADLNAQFRDKPSATNVLSWPSQERGAEKEGDLPAFPTGDTELGDIAISFDTCRKEAERSGATLKDHVTHLIVHGVLHLLGYDHERDGDGDLMEATEIAILAKLGVPNPY